MNALLSPSRRALLRLGAAAAAVCAAPAGWAQLATGSRLLVNEAVTADLSISMPALRYKAWADYMASIVHARQLGGRKLLMPDEFAATSALAKAELRRLNMREQPFISHTKFQDSVASQVKLGMAEAGVVNPTIARKWKEAGGTIIGETQPVVNWTVLAAPKAPAELVARLTESMLATNAQAPAMLADIGVKQWARAERKDYLALLDYTGE